MALKRYKLVALDADLAVLKEIAETVAPHFDTIRLRDAGRVVSVCDEDPDVRIYIGGPAVFEPTGASVLAVLKARHPHIHRVMTTTYGDLAAIVTGLHEGTIQHLVRKPIIRAELLALATSLAPQVAQAVPGATGASIPMNSRMIA
jgi:response regulator RpfG family c-di-GMP phosphodiesterase